MIIAITATIPITENIVLFFDFFFASSSAAAFCFSSYALLCSSSILRRSASSLDLRSTSSAWRFASSAALASRSALALSSCWRLASSSCHTPFSIQVDSSSTSCFGVDVSLVELQVFEVEDSPRRFIHSLMLWGRSSLRTCIALRIAVVTFWVAANAGNSSSKSTCASGGVCPVISLNNVAPRE